MPAWPARLALNSRLTIPTACVEVMPTGLSSTTQPCTSRFSRRNCCFACCALRRRRLRNRDFVTSCVRRGEVLERLFVHSSSSPSRSRFHRRRAQQLVDALRLVEPLVQAEAQVGRKLHVDVMRNFLAHEFLVLLESGEHRLCILAAERHQIDRRKPQVGRHLHLGNGDEMTRRSQGHECRRASATPRSHGGSVRRREAGAASRRRARRRADDVSSVPLLFSCPALGSGLPARASTLCRASTSSVLK